MAKRRAHSVWSRTVLFTVCFHDGTPYTLHAVNAKAPLLVDASWYLQKNTQPDVNDTLPTTRHPTMSLLSMGNGGLSDLPEDQDGWGRFKTLLDDQNDWPTHYTFKFIVPAEQVEEVKAVLGGHPVRVRASSKGTYKSVTAQMQVPSSKAVVDVYKEASSIDGIIPL